MLGGQPSLSAPRRAFSVRTHLLMGYVGVVALLALACTTSWLVAHRVRTDYQHTVQIDDELSAQVVLRTKLLDDEETGLRGYLLTGSRVFLQPYLEARRSLPGVRRTTLGLAADEPAVRPLLAAMTMHASRWESWARGVLRQDKGPMTRSQSVSQQLRGKSLFDAYRVSSNRALRHLTIDRSRHLASDLHFLGGIDAGLPVIFLLALALVMSVLKRTTSAIAGPLRGLERAARAIGAGDLATEVRPERIREFATLAATMDQMRHDLRMQKDELDGLHQAAFTQARRDPLTALPNRLQLREDLETLAGRVERYGHTYSLILCDVDHFKAYNDYYGHQTGDGILCTVADTLRRQLRQGDTAYRYGGEEFLIILPETEVESAIVVGQRLRQSIEDLGIAHEGVTPGGTITMSMGVAAIDGCCKHDIDAILGRADAALYEAKRAGRNRLVIAG